jgi:hypothetical protein
MRRATGIESELNHRIELQHEQRDIRTDQRTSDERIGEHAKVLHRRDHDIAFASYTFHVPLDVAAEVISNVHLSPDYNVVALAAPEIAERALPGTIRDGESRRSSRAVCSAGLFRYSKCSAKTAGPSASRC